VAAADRGQGQLDHLVDHGQVGVPGKWQRGMDSS
jgi:hypothetical protein